MKHLKRIFEKGLFQKINDDERNNKNLIQDIKDICLESEDIGFKIDICTTGWSRLPNNIPNKTIGELRFLEITKPNGSGTLLKFYLNDIADILYRISDYMAINNYSVVIEISAPEGPLRMSKLNYYDNNGKELRALYQITRKINIKFLKNETSKNI